MDLIDYTGFLISFALTNLYFYCRISALEEKVARLESRLADVQHGLQELDDAKLDYKRFRETLLNHVTSRSVVLFDENEKPYPDHPDYDQLMAELRTKPRE